MRPQGWWPAYAGRVGGVLHKFSDKLTLTPARQVEFLPRAGHLVVPAPPRAPHGRPTKHGSEVSRQHNANMTLLIVCESVSVVTHAPVSTATAVTGGPALTDV